MHHPVHGRRPAVPDPDRRPAVRLGRKRRPAAVLLGAAAVAVVVAGCSAAGTTSRVKLAAAGDPNPDCTLIVPADPLSAAGLATPYKLTATNPAAGPCKEANADQSAFIQGAIVTPNGQLTLYNPVVIDRGDQPAAAPAPAQVPPGSVVGLWFGFNGTNLTLRSANGTGSLARGNCVNGLNGSVFSQFAYCNAPAFFQAANNAINSGALKVPPLATARDGLTCPTVRDFAVIDQDQSDNVTTHYLATPNGRIAQPNAAAVAKVGAGATDLSNGSDNLLLTAFMDPTLGCAPWTAPDQSDDNKPATSLPLDELQAARFQGPPVAIVPLTDPMALLGTATSVRKTNLFRAGVDQAPIGAAGADGGDGATYCRNLFTNPAGIQRVFNDQALFATGPTVDAAQGTNLFTFLAQRGNASFTNLNCGDLMHQTNPITLTTDGNGVTTAATFTLGGAPVRPSPSATATHRPTHHHHTAPGGTNGTTPAPTGSPTGPPTGSPSAGPTAAPSAGPTGAPTAAAAPATTAPPAHRRHQQPGSPPPSYPAATGSPVANG